MEQSPARNMILICDNTEQFDGFKLTRNGEILGNKEKWPKGPTRAMTAFTNGVKYKSPQQRGDASVVVLPMSRRVK